ncbi:MAG: YceI family protein [Rhodanobacteraceae bacterium]|nr:YceI family protein [Pseudomonadota bacterium]
MKHRASAQAIVFAIAAIRFVGAAAADSSWSIDAARSHASFNVRTLWFTHVQGRFDALRGELRSIDAQRDVVDAWIDANDLAMDGADALAEARGPGFFDVERYPRIHFVSAPFPVASLAGGGTLQGELELHGQRHPAQFTLLPSTCPAQPLTCPVRVHGTLARGEFGMHAHRGLLSDRVSLDLHIVLDGSD